MAAPAVLSLRPATEQDRSQLANLLHFETHVHRHLDWRRPLDWLGQSPFLISESGRRLTAALACPQDPAGIAWVRLFAVVTRVDLHAAWQSLWTAAREQLLAQGAREAAAIPLSDWFKELVAASGFEHTHNVVVLTWDVHSAPTAAPGSSFALRPMTVEDLPAVHEVDRAAFAPLWQNSLNALQHAFQQAGMAAVIQDAGRIVAYQLSTHSVQGLHLARLATHPDMQGRGLAQALVADLQHYAQTRREPRLTVNTQDNNGPSLGLYQKLGFVLTQDRFPVFQQTLR